MAELKSIQKGKIPPQAIEIEEAILGALMVDGNTIVELLDILFTDVFHKQSHRYIFEAIKMLFTESKQIDLLTVSQKLKENKRLNEAGGDFYLVSLTNKVSSSAHSDYHARILLQKYAQRKLITTASETIEDSYNESNDIFEIIDNAYNSLNSLSENIVKKQESKFEDIIDRVIEKGIKIYNGDIKPGIQTPISNLTKVTGGWRGSELIILAARPGMGKTAFALKCGLFAAKQNIPIALFSLEMNAESLSSRLLSMECKIDSQKFNIHGLNKYDQEEINKKSKELKQLPIYIDDTSSLSISNFQVKAKRLKNKHGIKLIVVDYLQLMTSGNKGSREQEISSISRGLKKVAMDLNVPVIALSQLSRAVETRGGSKRPLLSDLRESGAIEQDADMVMFLYRPEYYGIEYWDDYDELPTKDEAEYLVSKNRNGGLCRNRMKFEGKYTLFEDLDSNDDYLELDNNELPTMSVKDAFPDNDNVPF